MEKVLIICWDGMRYYREATDKEIGDAHNAGVLKGTTRGWVFDYRGDNAWTKKEVGYDMAKEVSTTNLKGKTHVGSNIN